MFLLLRSSLDYLVDVNKDLEIISRNAYARKSKQKSD
jgi:hypothetical protein